MNWLLSWSLLFYWVPNIFCIRCNSFKLLDHLQCLFLENLRGRMENKLACKRDSEKKQAMPLAARSLGKMSKMRDTIVSHYALAALHSGDKVILLVGLQKWHAVHAKFCCNVCLLQWNFHGYENCCSIWNSDLVEYSHLNKQYENCWEVIGLVSVAICPTSCSLSSLENYLFCIPVLPNGFFGEGEAAWSLLNYK